MGGAASDDTFEVGTDACVLPLPCLSFMAFEIAADPVMLFRGAREAEFPACGVACKEGVVVELGIVFCLFVRTLRWG